MQKLGVAVIHMPQNFNELIYVIGDSEIIDQMSYIPAKIPFDDRVVEFLDALSNKLLKIGKSFSDVMTFAFWCRKSSIIREKEKYDDEEIRLGRGIAFHSTPSNVAVNFAFSFAVGLLSGNKNIVRLPAKKFEQVDIICEAIRECLEKYTDLKPYIVMVRFPSVKEICDYFSSICDSRIVWGGDMTVTEMRKSPLQPRAQEITFADRYSILVLNSDEILKEKNITKLAQDFYNDTFLTDQNACTSPRIIIWLGNDKEVAKEKFWGAIHEIVKAKYDLSPLQAVGKLANLYKSSVYQNINLISSNDNLIYRIQVDELNDELPNLKYNSGYFYEYDAKNLSEIMPICTLQCQTMTYYGLDINEIKNFIIKLAPKGLDRIVPMGKSMDFSFVWDGYDLIRNLSRRLYLL